MIFALGFLAASLCALLVLPAVNARAARLARRRIDAMFPLSVSEIAAEKDYLRAQAAVAQCRLERKVEAVRAHRHADMAAIGARTLEIAALAREVEGRDAVLRTRDAEIVAARETLGGVEQDLGAARAEGVVGTATLQVLENAHRELLDDFLAIRQGHKAVQRQLTESEAHAATGIAALTSSAPEALAVAEHPPAELDDLSARYAALAAERGALLASLTAAEDALARLLADRDEGVKRDNADLRARIADVADALARRDHMPSVGAFSMPAGP